DQAGHDRQGLEQPGRGGATGASPARSDPGGAGPYYQGPGRPGQGSEAIPAQARGVVDLLLPDQPGPGNLRLRLGRVPAGGWVEAVDALEPRRRVAAGGHGGPVQSFTRGLPAAGQMDQGGQRLCGGVPGSEARGRPEGEVREVRQGGPPAVEAPG